MFAAHIRRLRPGLLLTHDPDNLLFREPARLHVHPPASDGRYPFLEEFSGLMSPGTHNRAPNLYAALETFKSEQSTANYQP